MYLFYYLINKNLKNFNFMLKNCLKNDIIKREMKNIIRAFRRIPEKNRTIAYGFMSFLFNVFFFIFKILVGIVFETPLLIAIAIYNFLIGYVKVNCSKGLLKHKDTLEDFRAYLFGGSVLVVSSALYIVYTANLVGNPYGIKYTPSIAVVIAAFAAYRIIISLYGLCKTKGRTMLIKEYKVANFASALTNIILTQMAILSFMPIPNRYFYNSLVGVIVGCVILVFGLYLVLHGLIQLKVYTTGVTNKKRNDSK